MTMRTEADAFACLAVLVAGIDGLGTMEERDFLFGTFASLPLFEDLDRNQFAALLSDASARVHAASPSKNGVLTDEAISELLDQICARLSPGLRSQAFDLAMGLASSDRMEVSEQRLMDKLRTHLLA